MTQLFFLLVSRFQGAVSNDLRSTSMDNKASHLNRMLKQATPVGKEPE